MSYKNIESKRAYQRKYIKQWRKDNIEIFREKMKTYQQQRRAKLDFHAELIKLKYFSPHTYIKQLAQKNKYFHKNRIVLNEKKAFI